MNFFKLIFLLFLGVSSNFLIIIETSLANKSIIRSDHSQQQQQQQQTTSQFNPILRKPTQPIKHSSLKTTTLRAMKNNNNDEENKQKCQRNPG